MKQLLVIATIILTMISCKKNRTCTCVWTPVSETYNGTSVQVTKSDTETDVDVLSNVTKNGANCANDTRTKTTVSGSVVIVTVASSACTLK